MKSGYLLASLAGFALFHSTANALNECMATLKNPHGSVIVRSYGKIVATLKGGEHFLVERMPDGWNVYLKSGCDGFIGASAFAERAVDEVKLRSAKDAVAKMAIGPGSRSGRGGVCVQRARP